MQIDRGGGSSLPPREIHRTNTIKSLAPFLQYILEASIPGHFPRISRTMKTKPYPSPSILHSCLWFCGSVVTILLLADPVGAMAQGATFALGTTNLLEGPTAGTDSVVLAVSAQSASWTATANAAWLHLSAANQGGMGSTIVIFGYDANLGATRNGTLTVAGQTLTVIQAGSTYIPAPGPATPLVSAGLNHPGGVAVDAAGNVYIADTFNKAIKKWTVANNTVTTLISSGLYYPYGVAVDGAGNVYIADGGVNLITNSVLKMWTAANNTVTTLISSGLYYPNGLAVDGAGNVYIADTYNNAIKEWTAANNSVTTLVSSGLNHPGGVAVDAAGNVYIADTNNKAIKKWTAATGAVTTWASQPYWSPESVAVDGGGNVYIADMYSYTIKKRATANTNVTTLVSSGLNGPYCVAVDGAGNVYIADYFANAVRELPLAFLDPTPKSEGAAGGSDVLPVVLPATANLLTPFSPSGDQPWLTINGTTNGAVNFSFASATSNRLARITLLGQAIPISQELLYSLGQTASLEGPGAGTDSTMLRTTPASGPWTATANAAWLHLNAANQSGAGGTNVFFSFEANTGPTRTGTLTIAGRTLTVTQAGSTYTAAPVPLTVLVASGLSQPQGLTLDGLGQVYIADTGNNALEEWTAAGSNLTTLVSSGLSSPAGVAADNDGYVYIADSGNSAIKVWTTAGSNVTTLVSSNLSSPDGLTVDGTGSIYIADSGHGTIKKWTAPNSPVATLVSSGLFSPHGVAVDAAGNVYIADTMNNAIKKWTVANRQVTMLVASGLSWPTGIAVDGAGNVYIADCLNNAIKKWTAASNTVTTLVSSGLNQPFGVAVDGAGTVYVANQVGNAIEKLPRAFVDPTPKLEGPSAGTEVLPVVLPATVDLVGSLAPSCDQPWLTIGSIVDGVVSLNFSANAGPAARTAHITLLGQVISVTQAAPLAPPTLLGATLLANGLFQFAFSNASPGAGFTVLSATYLSTPLTNWTVLGTATNSAPGWFQFTTPAPTTDPQRFYRVRSP